MVGFSSPGGLRLSRNPEVKPGVNVPWGGRFFDCVLVLVILQVAKTASDPLSLRLRVRVSSFQVDSLPVSVTIHYFHRDLE
eukprot:2364157-Rhodomonas_salina.1